VPEVPSIGIVKLLETVNTVAGYAMFP